MMRGLELRVVPDVAFATVGGLMWLASKALPSVAVEFPFRIVVAVALAGVAATLVVAAHVTLMHADTTSSPLTPERASHLVTTGAFALTRNPIYLAMLLLLLALAALLANPLSLAVASLFVVYIGRFQIGPEERALRERFGDAYDAYTRRVRRWV